MDPASAIGVAAAVVQFLEVSVKVAKRINEYVKASPGDVPKPLENITTTLPLITTSLSKLQQDVNVRSYDPETRTILLGVVLGCYKLTRELDDITDKIGLKHGESLGNKLKKVVHSFKNEERIQEIDRGLQAFIQVLILHQVVNKKDVHLPPTTDVKYFEVKKLRVQDAVPRKELLSKIHEAFTGVVDSSKDVPQFYTLQGIKGAGKSHIAVEYCHEAYEMGHYRAVFWLDSSSPASVKVGLENASSVIRQSKLGSSEQKLQFVNSFLSDAWFPWLLVLDNYSAKAFDSEPLAQLLPGTGHGAVLVTTPDTLTPQEGRVVTVHKFLTKEEKDNFSRDFTTALALKDMSAVIDALTKGFAVDSYSWDYHNNGSPVVMKAASLGFDEAVKLLLEMGADPHLDKRQGTPLSNAAYGGHLEVIEVCLDYEESTGYTFPDDSYDIAVGYCLTQSRTDILKALLARRPDKIDVSGGRRVAEGFAEAAHKGDLETLRLMASHSKLPPPTSVFRGTALAQAVKSMQLPTLTYLLHELHFDINGLDQYGDTVLMVALDDSVRHHDSGTKISPEERKDLIRTLLDAGADINQQHRDGKGTVLHRAYGRNILSAVPLLLSRGADVLIKDEDGDNALQRCTRGGYNKDKDPFLPLFFDAPIADPAARKKFATEAFFIAAQLKHRELMVKALAEVDINSRYPDINSSDYNRTALLMAIHRDDLPMARMLVRKGADQIIPDNNGLIPLLLAADRGMDPLIKDLVKAPGSPGLEVTGKNGLTPLMLAVQKGHDTTVGLLLGLGADRDAMNDFGETAGDLAEEGSLGKPERNYDGYMRTDPEKQERMMKIVKLLED